MWVRRPVDTPHAIPTAEEAAAHAGSVLHAGSKQGRLVKLPLGSLRLSFGYMSRFEDAFALLTWIKRHYTDRTVDEYVLEAGSGSSGAGGAGGPEDTEQERRRQERIHRAIALQGPGWC